MAIVKFVKWAYWNIAYLFIRDSKTFDFWFTKTKRCWWPWKEFIPNAWHNDDGRHWDICLEDASCYTIGGVQTVQCELSYAQDDHRVVGMTIFDGTLRKLQDEETVRTKERDAIRAAKTA